MLAAAVTGALGAGVGAAAVSGGAAALPAAVLGGAVGAVCYNVSEFLSD